MKSVVKRLGVGMPKTNVQGLQGRPSAKSVVKNPPRQPSQLGKNTWLSKRPGKVSIKGYNGAH